MNISKEGYVMGKLILKNINKIYKNKIQAVFDFDLEINENEFLVFVGPSGCGKSTTLKMIAGLEEISSGEIYIDGKLVNNVEPKDRGIAMVFQSYALFPYMSVYDNIAFGLKKHLTKEEIKKRVYETAKILEIETLLDRKANTLSGGQKQRAALGRALVRNANIVLMDEPFSNLDAKLRNQMRSEITRLHKQLKTTFIYVTHDQMEAMTMASRIVVMNQGKIQQVGTPMEVYQNPVNMFVAGFLGSYATNFIKGKIKDGCFHIEEQFIVLPQELKYKLNKYENKEVIMGIRPEDITYGEEGIHYKVEAREQLGHEQVLHGILANQKILVRIPSNKEIKTQEEINLIFDTNKIHFYDLETEHRIDE